MIYYHIKIVVLNIFVETLTTFFSVFFDELKVQKNNIYLN